MEFGNLSDWVQSFAAVAALGTSVFINKKSNDFSVNRDLLKDKKEREALINKIRISAKIILDNMLQRRSLLNKIEKSSPFSMQIGIDDPRLFDMCAKTINSCLEKCNEIDLIENIFQISQCLSHIKEDISEEKVVHITNSDLDVWIDTLRIKIESFPES